MQVDGRVREREDVMRPAGLAALLIFLMPAAVSTAAQEGPDAPSATTSISAIRGAVEGEASNVQSDNRATLPASHSDSYWYGRFGYGTIAGAQRYGGMGFGFGRRIERNSVGIDVLLFSWQVKLFGTSPSDLHTIGGIYTHAHIASLLTLKGLYFVRPRSRTTAYVGAGAGWRAVSFGRHFAIPDEFRSPSVVYLDEQWHGKGLEGELTVGYALARAATSTRFFAQADMTRPFYRAKRYSNREVVVGDRVLALTRRLDRCRMVALSTVRWRATPAEVFAMKSPPSLTLVICLMVLLLSVGAHARPAQSVTDPTQPSATRALDWTPVQQLESGREIEVTVKGLPPETRYFIFADESALTVLNLSDAALPEKARNVLRDMASHHPENLAAAVQTLKQFESREVLVGRPGIFVSDQKVADFERVVERIARTDVVRITAKVGSSGRLRGIVWGTGLAVYCSGQGWVGIAVCGPVGVGFGYASSHRAVEVLFPYHAVLPSAEEQAISPGSRAAEATPEAPSRSALAAESRFADARRLIRTGAGRVKDVTGVLISDSRGRKIQFDVDGRAAFAIPYERITAMHYEAGEYPTRFLRRSNFYLTVHYSDAAGEAAFETVRLLSARDILPALGTLERDTGLTIDRTLATRAFLGIPVRALVGARVAVTDQTGQTTKGTITQLSTSSLALDESAGAPRVFEEGDVRKIRLLVLAEARCAGRAHSWGHIRGRDNLAGCRAWGLLQWN